VPGAGFSDTTPVAPVGGNSGTTLGAQRLIALQSAADLWGAVLTSTEEIPIGARFDALPCNASGGTLGLGGSNSAFRDFAGAPVAGTWYPVALANSLTHSDDCPPSSSCTMAGFDPNDIDVQFQANIGTSGCIKGQSFYFGLDGNPGPHQIDFISIALHEIGHGLGINTLVNLATGAKSLGFDDT